jgi:hypothetical protein
MKKPNGTFYIDTTIKNLETIIDVMELDREADPQNQEISPQIAVLKAAIGVLKKFRAKW